ncbi:hypothetical protein MHU86_10518 [Fragilaria crotonensis]|nr:hypothetical protein MHU86_10518 [Fragilaria crotonensis]
MKQLQMFYQCWLEVTKQSRYRDKWLSDETFHRAIKAQFPSLESLGFDRGAMNRAISKGGGIVILDDFTVSNTTGLFQRQARGLCPFSNQKRNIWGYYITTPGGLVERPPDGKTNFLSLLQDESINDRYSIARGMPEIVDLTTQISQQSTIKRKAQAQLEAEDKAKKLQHGTASSMIVEQTYWDSPEAKKLFLGSMIEFHVNDHDFFHDVAKDMGYGVMGGNLSVRKSESSPSKPLMIFGQDESVFNQYLIGNRQWVGHEGQRALLPKTEGMGLMLSAFQSPETGFGLKLSRIQISEINETRRNKNYVNADAAIAIHGQEMKKDGKT